MILKSPTHAHVTPNLAVRPSVRPSAAAVTFGPRRGRAACARARHLPIIDAVVVDGCTTWGVAHRARSVAVSIGGINCILFLRLRSRPLHSLDPCSTDCSPLIIHVPSVAFRRLLTRDALHRKIIELQRCNRLLPSSRSLMMASTASSSSSFASCHCSCPLLP